MDSLLEPIRLSVETMTDKAFETLRDAIATKVLPPGQRIVEASLAQELHVSKTPVREALIRLRQVGLVEVRGNSMHVIQTSASALRDAFEYRAALERASAGLCAKRADDEEIAFIVERAQASLNAANAVDALGFRSADRQFHLAIAEATDNVKLNSAVTDVVLLASVLRMRDIPTGKTPHSSTSCAIQHTRIGEAIRDRDPKAASELMGQHIDHVYEIVSEEPLSH